MRGEFAHQFLAALLKVAKSDPRCAEFIERECEFFARECEPTSEPFGVHEIKVEDIGGGVIATIIAISDQTHVVFFELLVPEPETDD